MRFAERAEVIQVALPSVMPRPPVITSGHSSDTTEPQKLFALMCWPYVSPFTLVYSAV